MQIFKIIGITLIVAIVLGFIIGKVVTGYLTKKKEERFILSQKERIFSSVSVVVGALLIILGVVIVPRLSNNTSNEVINPEDDFYGETIPHDSEIIGGAEAETSIVIMG